MKRVFDIIFSSLGILVLLPIMFIIFIIITVDCKAWPIYWTKRVGRMNDYFYMPKFRTMKPDTPILDTKSFLMNYDVTKYITKSGLILRKTSLDEIPQLFSVLTGKMSIVGPRPALFTQTDLIKIRTQNGIHLLLPGVTGLAQINGRDNLSIEEKNNYDYEYLRKKSLLFDIKIILLTIIRIFNFRMVSH